VPVTPAFPLLPAELKYVTRVERSRQPLAQPYVPPVRPRPVRRTTFVPVRPHRSIDRRLPPAAVSPLCLIVAAALLPAGLAYLATCRPDLRGRHARRGMLTPTDVARAFVMRWTAGGVAAHLLRAFAGRVKSDGGWFG